MPKRSASSMTITVALGMSMPTSMTVVATRTSTSPSRKRLHRPALLLGGQLAVHQAQAQVGEHPLQALGTRPWPRPPPACRCPPPAGRPRRPDGRRRPAPAPGRTRPPVRRRPCPPARCPPPGGAAGISSSSRHVEVAVEGHRQGPRDGGGGHDEQVGLRALRSSPAALTRWCTPKRCCSSTTATPRRAKRTPSWMRAWVPTTTSTVPAAIAASTPSRSGESAVSRRHAHPHQAGQRLQAQVVLLGEDLGGRHHGPLVAPLHPGEQGGHGHRRLARPHLALQQAVHGVG